MMVTLNLTEHTARLLEALVEEGITAGSRVTGPDSPVAHNLLQELNGALQTPNASQQTLMDSGSVTLFGPGAGDEPGVANHYTPTEALENGTLVDVSEMARSIGYDLPVAMTKKLAADIERIPEEYAGEQDTTGRTWDVLYSGFLQVQQIIQKNNDLKDRGSEVRIMESTCSMQLPVDGKIEYRIKLAFCTEPGAHRPSITLMTPQESH